MYLKVTNQSERPGYIVQFVSYVMKLNVYVTIINKTI